MSDLKATEDPADAVIMVGEGLDGPGIHVGGDVAEGECLALLLESPEPRSHDVWHEIEASRAVDWSRLGRYRVVRLKAGGWATSWEWRTH